MKLLSWNVNGLRAQLNKGFREWLLKESPDILCLQETKCHPDQLTQDILSLHKYNTYWASSEKGGYSGVSVFTKLAPEKVEVGLGVKDFDAEGRTLILHYKDFILLNVYFPNGGAGNKRVPFKMKFYDEFLNKIGKFRKQRKNIVITGDVNTAHEEIDLARPKENEKNTGFLPEERAWVSKLINAGYVDTFRHFEKSGGHYTWWDYKTGARKRNVGWRIDYFFMNKEYLPKLKKAFILSDVMGSDHCPVGIELSAS